MMKETQSDLDGVVQQLAHIDVVAKEIEKVICLTSV
jgi:hypothetical protein